MYLYNTLSGKKEKLVKPKNRSLRLFVCGPTVYDHAHIGHARTYLIFDILVRYLKSRGFDIFYLQNITDVDDKIIERARQEKRNPLGLAKHFTKAHYADMKRLGVTSVNTYAPASSFIKEIVAQVETLIQKGYAYNIDGSGYYFDIEKFPDYGKLSRRTVGQAESAVSRIDESVQKKNKGDFCLWKEVKVPKRTRKTFTTRHAPFVIVDGEPAWWTPLGWGRPGWHIEDTAISEHFFGPQYDLHGGGLDLKFPHHEAEIAEQEAASEKKPFVKIWLHTGMVLAEGKKMAKSLKNFITIRDFLKQHKPEVLRYLVLAHHYRSPIDYTEALASQAEQSLESLSEFLEKLNFVRMHQSKDIKSPSGGLISKVLKDAQKKFHAAMEDDFNTPEAISAIFSLISQTNKNVWSLKNSQAKEIDAFTKNTFERLGFTFKPSLVPQKIKGMLEKRELLRTHKQFIQADRLRKKVEGLGYVVEDTPLGPFVRKAR